MNFGSRPKRPWPTLSPHSMTLPRGVRRAALVLSRDDVTTPFRVALLFLVAACDRQEPVSSPNTEIPPSTVAATQSVAPRWEAPTRPPQLVLQRTPNTCGVAALVMTLNLYGRPTTVDAALTTMPVKHDGVSALDIVNAAKAKGLGVKGVRVTAEEAARYLIAGDIVHLRASHFAVVERTTATGLVLLDPAAGTRDVDVATLSSEFSGVALIFGDSPEALTQRMATQ
jgi:predicted double-glycine peptidase